ncbi:MAG TPA: transposase [Ktedonobacteraceae bacterium]|nr:transposase [Ktedonobacteraceae bacterium]
MLLCQKIKIEVSPRDAEALEFMQAKCRGLYNWWVMKLRNGERWNLNRAKQALRESKQYDPELRFVYGKLLAEVYFRLDGAVQGFFRRVQAGEKPGFPRFKPRHQFFTLCYPAMYLMVQGTTIILPTGGGGRAWGPKRYQNIVAHLTEEPPEQFREVAVSRDARGNYSCSFVYDDDAQQLASETLKTDQQRKHHKPHLIRKEGIVAFDLGIKTLATGYTDQGHFYHIGGFKGYRWYNKQLDKIRAKRDKCKKKSHRYIYLSQVYKRVSEQKRRKQQDCLHKASHLIAHRLAERAVVIGDLSQRQMVSNKHEHENETPKERKKRHIRNRLVYNDWGLYSFVQMLRYKCLRFGKELHIISERGTTKTCHVCKYQQDMPLWVRTYRCANCGLVMDRDENSAINIYERFLARLGPHTSAI